MDRYTSNKNGEGYADNTAYKAIRNVSMTEKNKVRFLKRQSTDCHCYFCGNLAFNFISLLWCPNQWCTWLVAIWSD